MKSLLLTLLLFISLYGKDSFKIIQPATKSVFNEEFASVVIQITKKSSLTKLIIKNNVDTYTLNIEKNKYVYCKTVKLTTAKNTLFIQSYINTKRIDSKTLHLFHQSEVFENAVLNPKNYSKNYFHNNKNEKLCKQCHNMNTDKKKITKLNNEFFRKNQKQYNSVLNDITKSNCFDCHKSLVSRSNSHSPSVNFVCTKCHTGKVSEFNKELKNKSKYINPDPIDSKCFTCHENKEETWYKKESKHGPVMTGRCNKCHNPHSSNNLFFLRKPIWDLCTTCHDEKAKGKHVLSSFVYSRNKGAHPTKGRKDPARPGRELVCSSCHNPHGSDGIYLLRMKSKSTYGVCKRCHEK